MEWVFVVGFLVCVVGIPWFTIHRENKHILESRKQHALERQSKYAQLWKQQREDLDFFDFETDLVSGGMSPKKKYLYLANRKAMREAIEDHHKACEWDNKHISVFSPDRKRIRLELFVKYMNDYEADYALKYCLFTRGATKVSIPNIIAYIRS
jgi:hypothetical protein